MRATSRPWSFVLLALSACGPVAGAECPPGTGVVPEYMDRALCGAPPSSACGLVCTGPPGCDGEVTFTWTYTISRSLFYCDCDGLDQTTHADYGGLPTHRWRHWGRCEDGCSDVYWDRGWRWSLGGFFAGTSGAFSGTPVDPRCTRCRDAVPMPDVGFVACVGVDGLRVSDDCCSCFGATRSADGACLHPDGYELSSTCCP